MKKNTQIFILLIIVLSIIAGCASTEGYKRPITKFQDASSVVINSTRLYLNELNKVERNAYIDKKTAEKGQIILAEIEKRQVFSPEQIVLRLKTLESLSKYGELLGQLASSDAPERITSNAESLGAALTKLSTDISSTSSTAEVSQFSQAIGPVTTIVGEITSLAVEKKIQEALDKAVREGETPVLKLIETIRNDIVIAYERKRQAFSDKRVAIIDKYNSELKKINEGKGNVDKLGKYADELKSHLNLWEMLPTSNPENGLSAMRIAHKALVDYVKSDKNEINLADFVEAMEVFVSRARRIGMAVNELQNI